MFASSCPVSRKQDKRMEPSTFFPFSTSGDTHSSMPVQLHHLQDFKIPKFFKILWDFLFDIGDCFYCGKRKGRNLCFLRFLSIPCIPLLQQKMHTDCFCIFLGCHGRVNVHKVKNNNAVPSLYRRSSF